MAANSLRGTLSVPGTECVAIADLYDGKHIAGREALGKEVPVTRDYRRVLDRKDVDAVIIAATDHQHRRLVVDACAAGKDVYCEKPMSHNVEDGYAMVAAAQKGNRILQAGSQRVSSVLYRKAKEIHDSGKLGDIYSIDAHWDRNSASGAWVYPVAPDASEQTIDWNGFLGDAPKRPFDAVRFFRWRCYKDYGEGLAGDLFVHLVSGIHFITGTNEVAKKAQASGGLYRFKDGREFPDLIQSLYEYPKFQVSLRCNLNNETGEFIAFYGTKGTLVIKDATLTFTPQDSRPQPEGYSVIGWPASRGTNTWRSGPRNIREQRHWAAPWTRSRKLLPPRRITTTRWITSPTSSAQCGHGRLRSKMGCSGTTPLSLAISLTTPISTIRSLSGMLRPKRSRDSRHGVRARQQLAGFLIAGIVMEV